MMRDLKTSKQPSTISPQTALDRLQELLHRQLELVRQGNLAVALELFDETDTCVRRIATGAGASHWPRPQRQCIEHLYRELTLVLAAQQKEVSDALRAIGRGKKVLTAYSRIGPSDR